MDQDKISIRITFRGNPFSIPLDEKERLKEIKKTEVVGEKVLT